MSITASGTLQVSVKNKDRLASSSASGRKKAPVKGLFNGVIAQDAWVRLDNVFPSD